MNQKHTICSIVRLGTFSLSHLWGLACLSVVCGWCCLPPSLPLSSVLMLRGLEMRTCRHSFECFFAPSFSRERASARVISIDQVPMADGGDALAFLDQTSVAAYLAEQHLKETPEDHKKKVR